jgi:dTDP-4-dehydrorhamnose 3,5-epimerase
VAERLSGENKKILWMPTGFAHGFLTLSETADVAYKVSEFRVPHLERTLLWNDPQLAIDWPLAGEPILSEKDHAGHLFRELQAKAAASS